MGYLVTCPLIPVTTLLLSSHDWWFALSAPPLTCELRGIGPLTSWGATTVWCLEQSSLNAALKFSHFSRRERGVRAFRSSFLQSLGMALPWGKIHLGGIPQAHNLLLFAGLSPWFPPSLLLNLAQNPHCSFLSIFERIPKITKERKSVRWRKTHPWVPVLWPGHRMVQTSISQATEQNFQCSHCPVVASASVGRRWMIVVLSGPHPVQLAWPCRLPHPGGPWQLWDQWLNRAATVCKKFY